MCSECRQTPCHPRCPNAPEPKIAEQCKQCGEELQEGYEYYTDYDNNKFCSVECALYFYDIKSVD